ncbi:leucyl aminopeptidase [Actinoallomurus rhizosphaericola]|uniref:leucyl aminopeptidase n=1 Tax=Actinoallomurus rhizosphaericola TaxID=2952536 RepID=UPI002091B743|nr:leucyl aminopeptidase [Actinoallomurus rhizosphaericola]MCO5992567.1 leucyl aminopeptidase [Actinoallomurus rhizosphaericola]
MPVSTQLRTVHGTIRDIATTAEVVAVPVRSGPELDPLYADEVAGVFPLGATDLLAHEEAKGGPGELVGAPCRLGDGITDLLLYGVGDGSPAALRRAGAAVARRGRGRAGVAVAVPSGAGDEALAAFAEGLLLASYDFRVGGSPTRPAAETITLLVEAGRAADSAVERGVVVARAVAAARDLVNTPSLEKTPRWLAEQAERFAAESGLTVRVRDEEELRAGGFGGIVAVGSGSARPPRLIELAYEPETGPAARHVVLVGKGITFDSGGLSLKSNGSMQTMKTDMAGGAAVIGAMTALRALRVPVRVTGLIAAAENLPSGSAMRPGDVIRHYGGITSEVLNTDAEGRLVLADALAYADAELDPDALVDLATLTGAAKVALGQRLGALYATEDALAAGLLGAGADSGEPLWRMPLTDDYRQALDSDVADLANAGRGGFRAGSIVAALFLREFTGRRAWAHLDIAGPARAGSDDAEVTRGGTGFGVRLLLRWLSGPDAGD